MLLFRNKKLRAVDQVTDVVFYLHKAIILFIGKNFDTEKFWNHDYVVGFYSVLIGLLTQKYIKNQEDIAWVTIKIMEKLNPEYYEEFIKIMNMNANNSSNKNFQLGIIHASDLYTTFEGIPMNPEFVNEPHMVKARETSTELDEQLIAKIGNLNENRRVAISLIKIYAENYF